MSSVEATVLPGGRPAKRPPDPERSRGSNRRARVALLPALLRTDARFPACHEQSFCAASLAHCACAIELGQLAARESVEDFLRTLMRDAEDWGGD